MNNYKTNPLWKELHERLKNKSTFVMQDAYEVMPDKPKTTIRGRIYDKLGIAFERISNTNVYRVIDNECECIIIEGNGRDLSMISDNSIDTIITDFPWGDGKSNLGGNRNFANYPTFQYTLADFQEKARVLKPGSFLVEILPAENENNYKMLYNIKILAEEAGFLYYSKITWIKGDKFVSNTGRKAKNTEDVMIFSLGKARALRLDAKKNKNSDEVFYMSGTNGMLPTAFNIETVAVNKRISISEKPIELYEQIINYICNPGEIILDSFAGSGNVGIAALNTNRNCILIELVKEQVKKIKKRFEEHNYNINQLYYKID